jgi:very-short-patch-repair endonuclease
LNVLRHPGAVHSAINETLRRAHGVARREWLLRTVSPGVVDGEVRRGSLVALFPAVYCRPWDADLLEVRDRAAVLHVAGPVLLSHLTALRRFDLLPDGADEAVHVLVPAGRGLRSVPGRLVVHRHSGRFPPAVRLRSLPTVDLPAALVQSWPLLDEPRGRKLVIDAVRERHVDVAALRAALEAPKTSGRRSLLALCDLLDAGCESELEIHGLLRVFTVSGLRHGKRQLWVSAGGRRYRLDLAFEAEKVAVELDGGTHSGDDARESDTRRDAALAAAGWLTVRFTYWRLVDDPDGCRRDLLRILASRRRPRVA